MAASAIPNHLTREIVRAVDTIITTCATTSIETLFKRGIEVPDEKRIRRNIAFALLTGAGFESATHPKMGGFGGFATDSCRQAILLLRTFYRDQSGPSKAWLYRREALYELFKKKLNSTFGKENTETIPSSLVIKKVKEVRKNLFFCGYSLNMLQMHDEQPLPSTPFYAVKTLMLQKQENRPIELSNEWLGLDGNPLSTEQKQLMFAVICNPLPIEVEPASAPFQKSLGLFLRESARG